MIGWRVDLENAGSVSRRIGVGKDERALVQGDTQGGGGRGIILRRGKMRAARREGKPMIDRARIYNDISDFLTDRRIGGRFLPEFSDQCICILEREIRNM